MATLEDEFVIDVAKEQEYNNQTDEYCEEFLKWRTDKKNPFGYKFVHDKREHTYVDGEGYLEKKPDNAEQKSLGKCCVLLSATMIVMLLIDICHDFVMVNFFNLPNGTQIYYSQLYDNVKFNKIPVLISLGFVILKYLIPLLFVASLSKLPRKVAMPSAKSEHNMTAFGVLIILMVMAVCRFFNYTVADLLQLVRIDSNYYEFTNTNDISVVLIFFVVQCGIVPIIIEVFFRGYILQIFRQFGDLFAILISSFVAGMCSYSISRAGHIFCISVVLGIFAIKTGSIYVAIVMRICARLFNYFVTYVLTHMNYFDGKILEYSIGILVLISAIIAFSRLMSNGKWSFNIQNEASHLTNSQKFRVVASNSLLTVWTLLIVMFTILSMRFL